MPLRTRPSAIEGLRGPATRGYNGDSNRWLEPQSALLPSRCCLAGSRWRRSPEWHRLKPSRGTLCRRSSFADKH